MTSGTTVVVLAAGKGTRMKSPWPKVLHPLCGRDMLAWVMDQAAALDPDRVVLVVGSGAEEVSQAAADMLPGRDVRTVVQEPQRGTGHAVQVAVPELADGERVVVLYGDMPLLRPETLVELVELQKKSGPGSMALTTSRPESARGYGRILRGADGSFERIVEEKDATPEQRSIDEVNVVPSSTARGALASSCSERAMAAAVSAADSRRGRVFESGSIASARLQEEAIDGFSGKSSVPHVSPHDFCDIARC